MTNYANTVMFMLLLHNHISAADAALTGGMSAAMPQLQTQSVMILPKLHPTDYVNHVV